MSDRPLRRTDVALLLPGWGTSSSRFAHVREHLDQRGIRTEVHPVHPDALIDALARRARRHVRRLHDEGMRVHVVGHSLGGLVAAWAATDDDAPPLQSVTTINTPWRGTWLAWTGTGPLAAQLRYQSNAVQSIRHRLGEHLEDRTGPQWLVLGAALDLGTPLTTSLRPGSTGERLERRLVWASGHSISLLNRRLARRVADHVAEAAAIRAIDDDVRRQAS